MTSNVSIDHVMMVFTKEFFLKLRNICEDVLCKPVYRVKKKKIACTKNIFTKKKTSSNFYCVT